jgi:transposase
MEIKVKTAQGIPLSRVAAECGIDRKTARKLRDAPKDPSGPTIRNRQSRFVEHTEYVRERLKAGVPIAQIVRDLTRAVGVPIPYTSFWEFASKLKANPQEPREEVRFETTPAKQGQCDWADFGTIIEDGQAESLSLFVMVLGYSRHTFARFVTSMDESSLQREHHAAFVDFGGVPSEIVRQHEDRDNGTRRREQADLATVVRRLRRSLWIYTEVRSSISCQDERQGRTDDRLYSPLVSCGPNVRRYHRCQCSAQDLARRSQHAAAWYPRRVCTRTIRRRAATANPIAPRHAHDRTVVVRTVDAEGAIVYESNHYELPRGFRGRTLTVRDDGHRLRVFDAGALICEHELLNGRTLRAKRTHVAEARLRTVAPVIVERRALDAYDELIG